MKLMWFHLMPYTELPEDFRDKHPSVWVDIHSSLFDPRRAHLMYNDFMDELEFAAECGFDAVCVNEHHSNGYGLMPSPNLIATALARRTTEAAICVMGKDPDRHEDRGLDQQYGKADTPAEPVDHPAAGPEAGRREQRPRDIKAAVFGRRPAVLLREEQRHPHADGAVGNEGHSRDERRHRCAAPQVGQE